MNPNKRIAVVFPDEFNGVELYRVKFSGGPFWQQAGTINFLTKKQAEALAAAWEASSPAEEPAAEVVTAPDSQTL